MSRGLSLPRRHKPLASPLHGLAARRPVIMPAGLFPKPPGSEVTSAAWQLARVKPRRYPVPGNQRMESTWFLVRACDVDKKQDFYEGAALHLLARSNQVKSIRYDAPLFFINDRLSVLLKYCTKIRSPWGFTFTPDEQSTLKREASKGNLMIGLICGADGVAAISYPSYVTIAAPRKAAVHIACYRQHWEHYEVSGPDGTLDRKVSPSNWQKILENGVERS